MSISNFLVRSKNTPKTKVVDISSENINIISGAIVDEYFKF